MYTHCDVLWFQEEDIKNAIDAVYNDICNKQVLINTEYKSSGVDYASFQYTDSKEDIIQGLISEGLLLAENRKEKRLTKLVSKYKAAQDKAKKDRVSRRINSL